MNEWETLRAAAYSHCLYALMIGSSEAAAWGLGLGWGGGVHPHHILELWIHDGQFYYDS